MSIKSGVRFLFAKAPICKWFHIPFNESRLYGNAIITVNTIFDFTGSQTLVGFGTEFKNGSANRSVFKLSYGRRTVQPFVICASVYTENPAQSDDWMLIWKSFYRNQSLSECGVNIAIAFLIWIWDFPPQAVRYGFVILWFAVRW